MEKLPDAGTFVTIYKIRDKDFLIRKLQGYVVPTPAFLDAGGRFTVRIRKEIYVNGPTDDAYTSFQRAKLEAAFRLTEVIKHHEDAAVKAKSKLLALQRQQTPIE